MYRHCDGSVRLWLCYKVSDDSPFSFKCALVVHTADYFSQLDDAMKEVLLTVCYRILSCIALFSLHADYLGKG